MKRIGENFKSIMAGACGFGLAVLIGIGGTAAAAVDDRQYVGTKSTVDVWGWNLATTKWDHQQDRWIRRPQDAPDPRSPNPEIDDPVLD